ncbi:MAG TPA: alpha/beta hydrolase [Jatrophihabitans sp.]|nr:alpha/beta hydrolase [Jatrophihabitans sp.]
MRSLRVPVRDGSLAALHNTATTGTATVLLVPGYTGSKEDFRPLLRPLAAAGLPAVAIDQRGQYESDWARTAAGYELERLAEDVVAVAEQVADGRHVHLLGHSFGGLVARLATIRRPDLFQSLVLMDSGPAAIGGNRRRALEDGEPVLAGGGMRALWEHRLLQSQADPRYVAPAPALQEFLRTRFLANDPVGLRVMGAVLRTEPDRSAELAATRRPMLVLYGEHDDAWPPEVQAEMAARLGARVATIERAAHSPAVENPSATLQALLEFWQPG